MAKLKGMKPTGPLVSREHGGDPLAPDEIVATPGKTEVYVGGRLVGEIAPDAVIPTERLIAGYASQEEADEERLRAQELSKRQANRAEQSKKDVARMAR